MPAVPQGERMGPKGFWKIPLVSTREPIGHSPKVHRLHVIRDATGGCSGGRLRLAKRRCFMAKHFGEVTADAAVSAALAWNEFRVLTNGPKKRP
jgi:hypothetical protein